MKREAIKKYLLLLLIFILASLSTVWFDWYYRLLVIKLYVLSTNGKIHFFGKGFHLFPNEYFVLAFGLFCTTIAATLFKKRPKTLLNIVITAFSFFLTTAVISYIKSNAYLVERTNCNNGTRELNYGNLPYNTIFIESLIVSLIIFFVINKIVDRAQ